MKLSVFIKIFITFWMSFHSAEAAKVPPVQGCNGAYNHLFKNPYEELHYKTKKRVSAEGQVTATATKYQKDTSIEDFEKKLEFISLGISRLNVSHKNGYEKVILSDLKEKAHLIVNRFYFEGWDYISPNDIETLDNLYNAIYQMLVRSNQTDLLD